MHMVYSSRCMFSLNLENPSKSKPLGHAFQTRRDKEGITKDLICITQTQNMNVLYCQAPPITRPFQIRFLIGYFFFLTRCPSLLPVSKSWLCLVSNQISYSLFCSDGRRTSVHQASIQHYWHIQRSLTTNQIWSTVALGVGTYHEKIS